MRAVDKGLLVFLAVLLLLPFVSEVEAVGVRVWRQIEAVRDDLSRQITTLKAEDRLVRMYWLPDRRMIRMAHVVLPRALARTTSGFAFSILNRALLEGISDRKFGAAEMRRLLEYFGSDQPRCVYCGAIELARWDHLIPVKAGGDTVLGNMVPACAPCDDSKRDLDFAQWLRTRKGGIAFTENCGRRPRPTPERHPRI